MRKVKSDTKGGQKKATAQILDALRSHNPDALSEGSQRIGIVEQPICFQAIAGHGTSGLKPDLMACSPRIYLMIGGGAGHTCAASCATAGNLATGSMPSAIP